MGNCGVLRRVEREWSGDQFDAASVAQRDVQLVNNPAGVVGGRAGGNRIAHVGIRNASSNDPRRRAVDGRLLAPIPDLPRPHRVRTGTTRTPRLFDGYCSTRLDPWLHCGSGPVFRRLAHRMGRVGGSALRPAYDVRTPSRVASAKGFAYHPCPARRFSEGDAAKPDECACGSRARDFIAARDGLVEIHVFPAFRSTGGCCRRGNQPPLRGDGHQ